MLDYAEHVAKSTEVFGGAKTFLFHEKTIYCSNEVLAPTILAHKPFILTQNRGLITPIGG